MKSSQLDRSIRAKLKKWLVVYPKAYSGDILWPLALLLRKRTFNQVAITAAQLSVRGKILDIGTGPGHLPVEIATACPDVQVVGIDISADLLYDGIKRAKNRRVDTKVTFVQAKAESLPFADNSFETVLSMFSLHLWNDRQQGVIEIRRVLIPGGRALILVGRQRLVKGLARITDFVTGKSIRDMKASCLSANFKEVKIKEKDETLQILLMK
jgi:ubiquinone/menaquinone biosynthesis C-methylase UbiE